MALAFGWRLRHPAMLMGDSLRWRKGATSGDARRHLAPIEDGSELLRLIEAMGDELNDGFTVQTGAMERRQW